MLENRDHLKIQKLEKYQLFRDSLNKVGITFSKFKEILEKLQFSLFKVRFTNNFPSVSDQQKIALKKFFLKLNLLEQKLFECYSKEKNNDLYSEALSTLATFYEFGAEFLKERDYLIRSMVIYCLSEYESNSQLIWEQMLKKDAKLEQIRIFDPSAENKRSDIEPIDIIIYFILLFFGRNFSELKTAFSRNNAFVQVEPTFSGWSDLFELLLNHIESGKPIDEDLCQNFFSQIVQKSSNIGISIYFWLIRRFEEVVKTYRENSIWCLKKQFPEIPTEYIKVLIREHKIEMWKSQSDALNYIKDIKQNLILCMPTSAGKTLVAEIQILRHIYNFKKKVIYVCPTNSLINQAFTDFRIHFNKLGINIAPLGGSYENINKFDNFLLEKASLIIVTPEKLDVLLRKRGSAFLREFSLVVLDEFQLIEDISRGAKYELLISRINDKIINSELELSFIILSACIPNSNIAKILNWLGSNRSQGFYSEWKPTRLIEGLFYLHKDEKYLIINLLNLNVFWLPYNNKDNSTNQQILELLSRLIIQFQPIMLFYERKDWCEKIIRSLFELRNDLNLTKINDNNIEIARNLIEDELGSKNELSEFLEYGLAFHHSGLSPKIRQVIESLIKTNTIKIFSCTTTFAQGVNFPVKSIIFHSMYLYNEETGISEVLSPKLYLNIVGRAGRALKFSEGTVLVADKNQTLFSLENNDLVSTISSMKQHNLQDLVNHLEEKLMQDDVLSNLHIDLLAENGYKGDLKKYLTRTYLSNIDPNVADYLPYLKIQKKYIEESGISPDLFVFYCESGLTIPFCKKLHSFLDEEKIISLFNRAILSNEKPTECEAFKKVNVWIFQHFPKLSKIEKEDYALIDKWVNRAETNYKEIVEKCSSQQEVFEKLRIIHSFLDYYFPWIWSFVIRLILKENRNLRSYIERIPDYLKFGANTIDKLIEIVYENNKHLLIDGKELTKNQFSKIVLQ